MCKILCDIHKHMSLYRIFLSDLDNKATSLWLRIIGGAMVDVTSSNIDPTFQGFTPSEAYNSYHQFQPLEVKSFHFSFNVFELLTLHHFTTFHQFSSCFRSILNAF